MAYLNEAKKFSHRPLKKRPLHLITEDLNNDDDVQPQDLRIKRRKDNDDQHCHSQPLPSLAPRISPPLAPSLPSGTPSLTVPTYPPPPLRMESAPKHPHSHFTPLADFYLQLFQRNAVVHQKQGQKTSPWDNVWPLMPPGGPSWASPRHHHPGVPPTLSDPVSPSAESHLSSPRSTSSEDSGLGSEFVSEDEVEVLQPPTAPAALERVGGRHSCDSCGKSYSTQSGLRKHGELHCASLGGRAFACKHCAKAYTSVGALKMHIRTHTLPCKCDVCGKAFSRPWLLQGHIRTHTGEKPFQCHQCQRSFADRSNLRAHLQTHERVKKYGCHACKKTFSRMSLLNKHSENACPGSSENSVETKQ